jgi:hypothetical protein
MSNLQSTIYTVLVFLANVGILAKNFPPADERGELALGCEGKVIDHA